MVFTLFGKPLSADVNANVLEGFVFFFFKFIVSKEFALRTLVPNMKDVSYCKEEEEEEEEDLH